MKKLLHAAFFLFPGFVFNVWPLFAVPDKPNIILILADDLGYSDIGCYGSEISTPNLNRLAYEGVRFTRFYNASRCCPSRASLLTGVYPHQAGIGGMTDIDASIPEYQGYLNERVVTIGEVLRLNGYATYLSGKWHVGEEAEAWPYNRGFDRTFANITGLGSYFDFLPVWNELWPPGNEVILTEDGKRLPPLEGDYYVTDLFTDRAIQFITQHPGEKPFFLYLGYTAPHWPLHALPEDIEKYKDAYLIGWDRVRENRFSRLKEIGMIPQSMAYPDRDPQVPAWHSLDEQEQIHNARLMAVHAAMIDRMDQNIGRLLDHLKEKDYYKNTVIIFLSDNGAAKSGNMANSKYMHSRFLADALPGTPASMTGFGRGWANVSNTPFRDYKASTYEGGIATPFVAWYPAGFQHSIVVDESGHILDILPTLVDLIGGTYPDSYNGHKITPLEGESLLSLLCGTGNLQGRRIFWEHIGNRAVIDGEWKLVSKRDQDWELYDLSIDPIESNNLSPVNPEKLEQLREQYNNWMSRIGVRNYNEVEKASPYEF